jgi:hypothetical protein
MPAVAAPVAAFYIPAFSVLDRVPREWIDSRTANARACVVVAASGGSRTSDACSTA